MGRQRKFSKEELSQKWEEYKEWCDNQMVMVHDFSAKNSEFVSAELRKSITYTIEGFCAWLGLPRATFYASYRDCRRYIDIVTRMREECEVDARRKFETGMIPTQLAGLWMSKHGYTTKTDTEISADEDSVHSFLNAIKPSSTAIANLYAEE